MSGLATNGDHAPASTCAKDAAPTPSKFRRNLAIGTRIHIMGDSCAGKSTLAARLADGLGLDFVDMDALNWLPNWVGLNTTDPDEFDRRLQQATAGDGWIVAGSYTRHSQRVFWPRLETVVWLDLPLSLLLKRVLARSWRRWRTKELLWGTNYEEFWPQLMVWRKEESLVWWIITSYERRRRQMLGFMADPRWSHIRFVRLTSPAEIEAWTARIMGATGVSGAIGERIP